MVNPIFADGIGAIAIIGGTVRIDFVALSPDETDPENRPKPVVQQRIVMTMDAFLRASEKLQEATQTIAKVARGEMPAAAPAVAAPEAVAPAKRPFP